MSQAPDLWADIQRTREEPRAPDHSTPDERFLMTLEAFPLLKPEGVLETYAKYLSLPEAEEGRDAATLARERNKGPRSRREFVVLWLHDSLAELDHIINTLDAPTGAKRT